MSSFYEKVVAAAREANERSTLEYFKDLIMGHAISGDYQLVLGNEDIVNFSDTINEYLTSQGFSIDKSEKGITISWDQRQPYEC